MACPASTTKASSRATSQACTSTLRGPGTTSVTTMPVRTRGAATFSRCATSAPFPSGQVSSSEARAPGLSTREAK